MIFVYTLDTNTIIYYIKDDPIVIKVIEGILAKNSQLYVSTISEVELFRFPELGDEEARRIDALLGTVSNISVDSRIARWAAEIGKLYGFETADSIIAATALFIGTTLLTRNIRDFKKVPALRVEQV